MSRGVVIQAEDNLLNARHGLQHPEHGVFRSAAEGHITVFLPTLRMQRQEGQQIDGALEHVEAAAVAEPVETAPAVAALHVPAEAPALGVEAPLVGVAGFSGFVCAHEHSVVVLLVAVSGLLAALVDHPPLREFVQDAPVDAPLLEQIVIETPPGGADRGQGEFFERFRGLLACRFIRPLPAQQLRDCLRLGEAPEGLEEGHGPAARLGLMIIPLAAPDGDAMIRGPVSYTHLDVYKRQDQYKMGSMTAHERYEQVVQVWEKTTSDVSNALQRYLDYYNPIFMMTNSGACGSIKQICQLAGMCGLIANTDGRTIEIPIKSNRCV